MKEIYLDTAATTPVYLEVWKVMEKASYGNPSSLHSVGDSAEGAMNVARKKLAAEIGAKDHEIIFTSGATESNNVALNISGKVVISAIEHPSVLESARKGRVEVKVNEKGEIDFSDLSEKIKGAEVVSIMHVNNEIGSINDIAKIGEICRREKVLFHTDAVQSFGKLDINVNKMNVDLLSVSAHKIGGPKGVGFLYIRSGIDLNPLILGGGQERGLRSGTENVPGVVGFAEALEVFKKKEKKAEILRLRKRLISGLEKIGGKINSPENGSPWIINASFPVDGETAVIFLSKSGILASTGSACSTKKKAESKTLREIGLSKKEIEGSIRLSLSCSVSEKDIDYVISEVDRVVKKLKV